MVGSRFALAEENWRQPRPLHGAAFLVDSALSWLVARPEVVDVPDKAEVAAGMRVSEQGRDEVRRYVAGAHAARGAAARRRGVVLATLVRRQALRCGGRRCGEAGELAVKAARTVTPVALIILAVAAVGYAYLVDRASVSDADRAGRRREVFPAFAVGEVQRVELDRQDERIVVERTSDAGEEAWAMRSPRQEPADPAAVDALLEELNVAVRLRDVPAAQGAGLESPRVRGAVRVGALEYRFALGASAPVPDGASFMRLDGEGTFVVGKATTTALLRGADAYRDRVLVVYGARDTQRLEVRAERQPGEGFVLTRFDPTFRLSDGIRASREGVERIFGALAGARADSFLPDADADRSVAAAADALTLVAEPKDTGRPRVELRVGGACPGNGADVVVVSVGPGRRSACVSRGAIEPLRDSRGTLADKGLFHARKDEVAELRLESIGGSGAVLDLARKGTGWHERAPEDLELTGTELDAANERVEGLADIRATDVRLPAPGEQVVARIRATIVGVDGATEVVEVGAPAADGSVPVRRGDDGAILKVPVAEIRDFDPRLPAANSERRNDVVHGG